MYAVRTALNAKAAFAISIPKVTPCLKGTYRVHVQDR